MPPRLRCHSLARRRCSALPHVFALLRPLRCSQLLWHSKTKHVIDSYHPKWNATFPIPTLDPRGTYMKATSPPLHRAIAPPHPARNPTALLQSGRVSPHSPHSLFSPFTPSHLVVSDQCLRPRRLTDALWYPEVPRPALLGRMLECLAPALVCSQRVRSTLYTRRLAGQAIVKFAKMCRSLPYKTTSLKLGSAVDVAKGRANKKSQPMEVTSQTPRPAHPPTHPHTPRARCEACPPSCAGSHPPASPHHNDHMPPTPPPLCSRFSRSSPR